MTTDFDSEIAAISEEIRRYPTPIARCDEQLTALLEQRARLLSKKGRATTNGCSPDTIWINDGGFNAA
jgi:chorismate mutase